MGYFTPAEMTANYSSAGEKKATTPALKLFLLAILAGWMIGFPAMVTDIACYTLDNASVIRMVSGVLFAFGLGLVIMTGAELFTGNTLMVISVLDRRVRIGGLLRNWGIVYVGNFVGTWMVSFLCARFGWMSAGENALALYCMKVAQTKMTQPFGNAFFMGVLCNILVTVGVLVALAGKDGISRFIGAWAPVMFFVTCGFNHSVADMGYCMAGLFAKAAYPLEAVAFEELTWGNYVLGNLLPVTLGNIVGGCAVGVIFWYCYAKRKQ